MNRTHHRVLNSVIGFVATLVLIFSGLLECDPDSVTMAWCFLIFWIVCILATLRELRREIRANKALFKEDTDVSKP